MESAQSAGRHRPALPSKEPGAAPFLKWAGGKTQLLPQLSSMLPERFERYVEPFVGSAALFFWLRRNRSFVSAHLLDRNDELINCYIAVRDSVDEVIPILAEMRVKHCKRFYYRIRAQKPATLTELERAARLIYMNKTCFNGLYRINSRGEFNVPIGSYRNPRIFDEGALREASRALSDVEIARADFAEAVNVASAGDLVYFDPPYHPISRTASFTSYALGRDGRAVFDIDEQRRLAGAFRDLDRKNCHVMLSNSDAEEIRQLYRGFRIRVASARRAINSDASARGAVSEIVVTNY